jgi:hypothetical protein
MPGVSKKRWLRYSLRTGLIVVTLLCVWLAFESIRARRQKAAVEQIAAHAGVAIFDYEFDDKDQRIKDAQPPGPEWIRKAVGDDYFRKVKVVDLSYGSRRRESGQAEVVDDDALAIFAHLTDVTTVEISNNQAITDKGLVHLAGLKKLQTLYLYDTRVEGDGLRHIARLPALTSLHLGYTPLTDEGLRQVGQMTQLTWLPIHNTNITDDGLKYLAPLTDLETLQLRCTDISDAGLRHLEKLPALKSISLTNTNVTAEGVRRLAAALPGCQVTPGARDLSREPVDLALWPEGEPVTRERLVEAIQQIRGSFEVDQDRPDKPITEFRLWGSDLSDEGLLRLLREMPHLEQINFRSLLVGDRVAQELPKWESLGYVALKDCRITDEGLKHLADMPSLYELDLEGARVTDQGLRELARCKSLKQVGVRTTRVTKEAIDALEKALPGCSVYR